MTQSPQGPPGLNGVPSDVWICLSAAEGARRTPPKRSSSIESNTTFSSNVSTLNSSSSSSTSNISRSTTLRRQLTVGVRFRPVVSSVVSPVFRLSPQSPSYSKVLQSAPQAIASVYQSAGGLSRERGGRPSSSTCSIVGFAERLTRGSTPSGGVPRRPPWAQRGPTDADWTLRQEEAEGWELAAPWALDMGVASGGASFVGIPDECVSIGAGVTCRGPPRVWDGYKDVCYEADCVFGPGASNAEVYIQLVKGLVGAAIGGRNAAVLAYGQTASGKTHTMFGAILQGDPLRGASLPQGGRGVTQGTSEKGIVELALTDIFQDQERRQRDDSFSVSISMLEVYQETVTDLLMEVPGVAHLWAPSQGSGSQDARQKKPIALCEKSDGTLDLGSVASHYVSTLSEALSLVKRGQQRRHAAATAMNLCSSRSHAVLRIVLTPAAARAVAAPAEEKQTAEASRAPRAAEKPLEGLLPRNPRRPSVFSLVDLAGSEGAGVSLTRGKTQREGGSINRSLLALSKVVKALTQQQKQQQQQDAALLLSGEANGALGGPSSGVGGPPCGGILKGPPFLGLRESKLTRLLSDCLGGPCLTSLICLCAPGSPSYKQTAATLAFARRARRVIAVQQETPERESKTKRHRSTVSGKEPAAHAAAADAKEPAAGEVYGSSFPSGGPQRQFVYVPTGCVQCRALHRALKEAREELACQAIQLRQLRYVISRAPPAAAAAQCSSSSNRPEETRAERTPRRHPEKESAETGAVGAPVARAPNPFKENETSIRLLQNMNYGGGVCYNPPQEVPLVAPAAAQGAPISSTETPSRTETEC